MLHKVKASHGDILKGLPELAALLPSSELKKKLLLEMARNGEQKPDHKTKLGQALQAYTKKSSATYDPRFESDIRKIRPDWLTSRAERADQKKQLLLEMARNGEQKPDHKTKLGQAFINYTRKGAPSYDPAFTKNIRKIAPQWFFTRYDGAEQKRQRLLEMARGGEPRPHHATELGKALKKYTLETSNGYNPDFTEQIRKLAPNWFVSRYDAVNEKKRRLLDMAIRKQPRPGQKTKIGRALGKYTLKTSESYDPDFTRKIKALAPQWFVTRYEVVEENKRRLLDAARKKLPRPGRETKIGRALLNYACPKSVSYDPAFAKKIRKLAPHWFNRCSTR